MSLKDLLVQQKPRDTSGALSSDRFAYQHNWALCRLLFLHQGDNDYVMTFDHHEDVTILDSEDDPKAIQGFQVKTKATGNWTVTSLLKRPEGPGGELPSILAKLCYLQKQFPEYVKLLQVVSNAPLSVKLEDGKKDVSKKNIRFLEMSSESRQLIINSLASEFGPGFAPALEGIFEFQISDLFLDDHVTHTRGKLEAALESLFPGRAFQIAAIYRALLGEIIARNNNREAFDTYEGFLTKKSISRSRFAAILQSCGITRKEPDWKSAEARLNQEQIPFGELRSLANEWDNAILDRLRKRDTIHLRFLERVRQAAADFAGEQKLTIALEKGATQVQSGLRQEWAYSQSYVKACILVHLYES